MRYHTKKKPDCATGIISAQKRPPISGLFCMRGSPDSSPKISRASAAVSSRCEGTEMAWIPARVIDQEAGEHQVRQHLRGAVLGPCRMSAAPSGAERNPAARAEMESLRRQAAVDPPPLGHHQDSFSAGGGGSSEKRRSILPGPLRPGQLLFQHRRPEQTAALLLHHLEGKKSSSGQKTCRNRAWKSPTAAASSPSAALQTRRRRGKLHPRVPSRACRLGPVSSV